MQVSISFTLYISIFSTFISLFFDNYYYNRMLLWSSQVHTNLPYPQYRIKNIYHNWGKKSKNHLHLFIEISKIIVESPTEFWLRMVFFGILFYLEFVPKYRNSSEIDFQISTKYDWHPSSKQTALSKRDFP